MPSILYVSVGDSNLGPFTWAANALTHQAVPPGLYYLLSQPLFLFGTG